MRAFLILLAMLAPVSLWAEDTALREEAERLLERASRESSPPNLPNLERVVTFHSYDSNSDGSFTRVVVQGTGRREEFIMGSQHIIAVFTPGALHLSGMPGMAPSELVTIVRITPIWLVRFDHEDVIQAINDSTLDGRSLRCIEFTTTGGEKSDENEICVDASSGTLTSMRVGNESFEYRDYFPFSGELLPGRILYSVNGAPRLELAQTMTELKQATQNVLAAPPNAQVMRSCKIFRRAFGENMPQPKPGNGGGDTDILVRGLIGNEGRVQDAVVQESQRADLNGEAVRVIRAWTFTPATCDGNPTETEATFTLHFRSR